MKYKESLRNSFNLKDIKKTSKQTEKHYCVFSFAIKNTIETTIEI